MPSLISGEALLAPFAGDNPCGENVLYQDVYKRLKEAVRFDNPAVLGGDQFKPTGGWKLADWAGAGRIAAACLAETSKDFRVAAYLARSLAEKHQVVGMREALWLLVELQERYWDQLYPEAGRIRHPDPANKGVKVVDPTSRSQDLQAVLEHFGVLLQGYPPCSDRESDEAILATLAGIESLETELTRLDTVIKVKYFGHGPPVSSFREALAKHASTFRRVRDAREAERLRKLEEEARRIREEEAARAEASRQEEEGARLAAEAEESRRKELAALGIEGPGTVRLTVGEPRTREEAMVRIASLSRWLRRTDPGDPSGYLLTLTAAWDGPETRPTAIDGPSEPMRRAFHRLVSERSWDLLAAACGEAFAAGFGRDWLDLASWTGMLLEEAGVNGRRAHAKLKGLVRERLAEQPDLRHSSFRDGVPLANEETQGWLDSVLAEGDSAGGLHGLSGGGITADVIGEAEALAAARQVGRALELLQSEVEATASGRQRFLGRLQVAEFCAGRGLTAVAAPLFRELAEVIEHRDLDRWENGQLLARIYEGIYRHGSGDGAASEEAKRLTRRAFERLCVLNPSRALESQ